MSVDAEEALLRKQGVYAHFGEIIRKVIEEKPEDPHKLVEILSRAVKEPLPPPASLDPVLLKKQADYHARVKDVTQVPKEDGEGGGAVTVCGIPNFQEESQMLEWAGVGFGDVVSYKVMCSLRRLAASKADAGLTKLRLWGKVLGIEADYWVAEAQGPDGEPAGDAEGEEDMEAPGKGANAYKYYVTGDLCDEWVELPDIKAKEIVAARRIKKLLTGRLGAPVITHPHFLGTEATLLRAQIARITADTVLCMKGYIIDNKDPEAEDAEPDIQENEAFVVPAPSALLELGAWTHMQPKILKHGRTTHAEVPAEPDDPDDTVAKAEREAIMQRVQADPMPSSIRDLSGDGLKWGIKQAISQKVVYVRSLTWQGAVCACKGGGFVNIYVGHALVAHEPDFFFCAPLDIQEEPEDPGDQPEPQGTEAEDPVEVEEGG